MVVEMAKFRLLPGTDEAAFLAAVAKTDQFLSQMDGVIRRELIRSNDGEWIDLVWWETLTQAEAAAAVFPGAPEAAAFVSMMDPDTVQMAHLDHIHQFDR